MPDPTDVDVRILAGNIGAVAGAVEALSAQLEEIKVILRQIAENLEEKNHQK